MTYSDKLIKFRVSTVPAIGYWLRKLVERRFISDLCRRILVGQKITGTYRTKVDYPKFTDCSARRDEIEKLGYLPSNQPSLH